MNQSHGVTHWREPAYSGGTPTLGVGRFVLVSTGIYELRDTGTLAASLVSDGVGGYDLSDSNLTGTGRVLVAGTIGGIV